MKAQHHLSKIEPGKIPPKGFEKLAQDLVVKVLPFGPTEEISLCKDHNAKTWKWHTIDDLRDHLQQLKKEYLNTIKTFPNLPDLDRAITIAGKWCSRDLKNFDPSVATKIKTELLGALDEFMELPLTIHEDPPEEETPGPSAKRPRSIQEYPYEEPSTPKHIQPQSFNKLLFSPEISPIKESTLPRSLLKDLGLTNNNDQPDIPLLTLHRQPINKSLWSLSTSRPIVIIGDSNLSRLPKIIDKRIQVDAFPGARIRHATSFLKNRTPTDSSVLKVILSFGLNDRTTSNYQLLQRDVRELLQAASATFPEASIFIPLINFDRSLPLNEKSNIQDLNRIIRESDKFITKLRREDYAVTKDRIHWTEDTGKKMAEHWLSFLV